MLNENKNGRFFVSKYSLPYLCYLLYSFAAVDARRQIEFNAKEGVQFQNEGN